MNRWQKLGVGIVSSLGVGMAIAGVAGDDFLGYWKTPEGDGIVQLKRCALYRDAQPTALCGFVVWDSDVANPNRTIPLACNRKVFEAAKFDDGVWKDGWAFDTRRKKFFSVKLRLKDDHLLVRSYVGSEMNGETEMFTRVTTVPAGCEGLAPEPTKVKG
jgi:uncharacterized protein (DUF2147 family)